MALRRRASPDAFAEHAVEFRSMGCEHRHHGQEVEHRGPLRDAVESVGIENHRTPIGIGHFQKLFERVYCGVGCAYARAYRHGVIIMGQSEISYDEVVLVGFIQRGRHRRLQDYEAAARRMNRHLSRSRT